MIPGFYRLYTTSISHINRLFEILFSRSQAVQKTIRTDAPTTDEIEEKELVFVDDGTSIRRVYTKLNGTLRYWDLT